jgi:hypothetical protein
MIVQTIEIAAGMVLAVFAPRYVFDTVVIPGESRGALRVARRLLAIMLPIWKWARRGKSGVSTSFAPAILMGSFLIWMFLLWLGFGLIAHALTIGSRRQPTSGRNNEGGGDDSCTAAAISGRRTAPLRPAKPSRWIGSTIRSRRPFDCS